MFCPSCGARIDTAWQYCGSCGSKVPSELHAHGESAGDAVASNSSASMDSEGGAHTTASSEAPTSPSSARSSNQRSEGSEELESHGRLSTDATGDVSPVGPFVIDYPPQLDAAVRAMRSAILLSLLSGVWSWLLLSGADVSTACTVVLASGISWLLSVLVAHGSSIAFRIERFLLAISYGVGAPLSVGLFGLTLTSATSQAVMEATWRFPSDPPDPTVLLILSLLILAGVISTFRSLWLLLTDWVPHYFGAQCPFCGYSWRIRKVFEAPRTFECCRCKNSWQVSAP